MNNSQPPYVEDEIDLRIYFSVLAQWWKMLILVIIISAGTAYFISLYLPPTYEATATLMVGQLTHTSDISLSEINTAMRLAKIYAAITTKEITLQSVINSLNMKNITWQQLKKKVKTSVVPDTQLLEITVQASTPEQSQMIANALAEQVIKQSPSTLTPEEQNYYSLVENQLAQLYSDLINEQKKLKALQQQFANETDPIKKGDIKTEIEHIQSNLTTHQEHYGTLLGIINNIQNINQLSIINKADLPNTPIKPRPVLNALIASALSLMLSIFAIFVWEYINDTIKNSDDVSRKLNLTTLGSVPKGLPNTIDGNINLSVSTHIYRTLRTNIQFSSLLTAHPAQTFLITGAIEGEGKSTTSANLAIAMANTGKKIILIDTDVYKPTIHQIFNIPNQIGWTNFVLHQTSLLTTLQNTHIENLKLVTSGPTASNIADFLTTEQIKSEISILADHADIIIFDGPPLLPVSDSRILATQLDVTLLVIKANSTRTPMCVEAIGLLEQVGAKPLGVILNGIERKHSNYYYNNYYSQNTSNINTNTYVNKHFTQPHKKIVALLKNMRH